MANKVAIITGDIVNSTQLTRKQEEELIGTLHSFMPAGDKIEFYRGDSFQAQISDPAQALEIALRARAAAKRIPRKTTGPVTFDIRISIGIGTVETPGASLTTAKGEAFILSGRAFDELENTNNRIVMLHTSTDKKVALLLKVMANFSDYLFQQLTGKQAAVIFELLGNHTQIEIAKKLKKTQATINKHVQSSGWPEISKLITEYKELLTLLQ